MLITILYSLWIAYTVGSLSVIGFVAILSVYAKWENKRNRKRISDLMKANNTEDFKDEGW